MPLMVRGSAFYFGDAVGSEQASLHLFYQWIKDTEQETQWPFIPREGQAQIKRTIFCDVSATHFYGVFLSARNAEYQHFIRREGNRILVEARSTGGNPPVEMNFFAIRLDSNKGLFSHYLGSYRFQQFMADLWASYRHFVDIKKAEELTGGANENEVQRRHSLRGKCNHSPLYRPGTFESLIERLSSIAEVRMTTYEVDEPADRPVGNNINSVHKVYRLDAVRVDAGVREWLREKRNQCLRRLASGRIVHSGSVIGEDHQGEELNINFENTLEDYLAYEYDDIGSFEINNLADHQIIADMVRKTSDNLLFEPARRR